MAAAFDLVVIGAGPAGYVGAIRAGQLGMKVLCVDAGLDKDGQQPSLGGTCLNVGCIPSKALLESTEHFHSAREELGRHGISTGEVRMDVGKMLARKDKIVRGLASGIGVLFAQNKVESVAGTARLVPGGRVEVAPLGGGPAKPSPPATSSSRRAPCPGTSTPCPSTASSWSIRRVPSTSPRCPSASA